MKKQCEARVGVGTLQIAEGHMGHGTCASTQRFLVTGTVVLALLFLATAGAYAQNYGISLPVAVNLSCDGKGSSADNVSTYTPMFSWQFSDADAGDAQTAYQIQVGTSVDSGDMWDLTETSATSTRMYAGSPLAPNTLYYWAVQVWDRYPQASGFAKGSFVVLDIGLRVYDGTSTIRIATDKVNIADPVTDENRLRINKSGTIYSIVLGDSTEYGASKIHIKIPSGTKALKMMVTPPPAVGLSLGNLGFSVVQGGASPAAQTVSASNVGGGTLDGLTASVSYGSGSGWLAASLNTTTAPATLTVTPSTGSLTAGTYTATVAVASGVAANSPQNVSVTLYLTCSVTYDANGATGGNAPIDPYTYLPGATVTVLGNSGSLVRTGYTFSGWNTQTDGSGTNYAQGQTFTMGSSHVTLYARWVPLPTYTVTYNGNGATGGSAPIDANTYLPGATVTVLGSGTLVRTGFALAGWNTQSNGLGTSYAANASFSMGTANVTLFAVWIPSNLTFTSSGTSIALTGYTTAPTGSLAIPGGVTSLNVNAFSGCSGLTSVTIPASVTYISYWAFQACTGLTSITIPSSVTYIGYEAFINCTGLTSIAVNGANQNYASIAGVLVNKAGTELHTVPGGLAGSYTIPSSITTIAKGAFETCRYLTSVTIPSSVTRINWHAFRYCYGLTSITIPASVTLIEEGPFLNCSSLTGINVDSANPNYKSISGVLFSKDGTALIEAPESMTGSYSVPAGVTSINWSAFMYSSLTSISLPNGVTVIGGYAFAMSQLTSFTIPSSVTSIETYAFERMPGLSSITIPSNVTSIGQFAFEACPNLSSVTVQAIVPPALPPPLPSGNGAFSFCAAGLQIHVPSASLAAYKAATGWSDYSSIIVSP